MWGYLPEMLGIIRTSNNAPLEVVEAIMLEALAKGILEPTALAIPVKLPPTTALPP
jgi:hypothetical protein